MPVNTVVHARPLTTKSPSFTCSEIRPISSSFELYKKLVTPGFYGAKRSSEATSPER